MVNVDMLYESYPSRPRKSVPAWSFVSLLLALLPLGVILACLFVPAAKDFFYNNKLVIAGLDGFEPLLIELVVAATPILLVPSFIVFVKMAEFRRGYWVIAWISIAVWVAMLFIGAIAILHWFSFMAFLPVWLKEFVNNYGALAALIAGGWSAFTMLLGLFYNCGAPLKYREIYVYRKKRLSECQSGAERAKLKKDFYFLYAKRKWDQLLELLFSKELEMNYKNGLSESAFEYLCAKAIQCEASTRKKEFDLFYREGDYPSLRRLYARLVQEASTEDGAQRRKREDVALLKYIDGKNVSQPKPIAPKNEPAKRPSSDDARFVDDDLDNEYRPQ